MPRRTREAGLYGAEEVSDPMARRIKVLMRQPSLRGPAPFAGPYCHLVPPFSSTTIGARKRVVVVDARTHSRVAWRRSLRDVLVVLPADTNRMIPWVLKEWREPSHPEFRDRTGWSLFNAFTEILKGNLPDLPKRTEVLHGLFDQQVKLSPAHLN